MSGTDDLRLLREFAEGGSEAAFGTLVQRHVSLVYSAALRQTGNPQQAEEITQAVFLVLARKAGSLGPKTILSGWLYHTTRLTAANYLRTERRRAFREQEAYMQSLGNAQAQESWPLIAPLLEEAMGKLGEKDRNAIVLRFFEEKSLRDVGLAMGASEDAVKMRVNRALEKLRSFFARRGVALGATALAAALSANAVGFAPPALAAKASAAALDVALVTSQVLVLAQATIRLLAWARLKIAVGLGTALLVAGGIAALLLPFRATVVPATAPVSPASRVSEVASPSAAGQRLEDEEKPELREPFTSKAHLTLGVPPGAVLVQPDGKLVLGTTLSGFFVDEQSGVLGAYRRGAMRILADGTLDRSFYCEVDDQNACDPMRAHLELGAEGRLLMTGLFREVAGKPRFNSALLLPDGSPDDSFQPWRGKPTPAFRFFMDGATYPAALLKDGSVVVGSTALEGPRAPYPMTIYRVEADGQMIPWVSAYSLSSPFPRPSGLVLTLGSVGFWARKPVDWQRDAPLPRRKFYFPPGQEPPVADLVFDQWDGPPTAQQAAIVLKALFDEVPLELCRYAVRLPNGGVILAVRSKAANGSMTAPGSFIRFDRDWHPDPTFTTHYEAELGSCMTLKLQQDGKLLVAGLVGQLNGEPFPGLVRLEPDGSIDTSFHCETLHSFVQDPMQRRVIGLALQEDGRIVISGYFTQVNGVECPHVARLNPDGSLDKTFRLPFTSWEGLKAWRRVRVQRLSQPKAVAGANSSRPRTATEAQPVAETVFITSLRVDAGVAAIQFTGKASQVYILQSATSLKAAEWSNVSTNRANKRGAGSFRHASAGRDPLRFYRIVRP